MSWESVDVPRSVVCATVGTGPEPEPERSPEQSRVVIDAVASGRRVAPDPEHARIRRSRPRVKGSAMATGFLRPAALRIKPTGGMR